MAEVREQALLDAPIAAVWDLVGDPGRYPEWFPRTLEVRGERFDEGIEFVQVFRQPLSGREEARFLIDRMDDLRELRMHCTVSGLFVHWQLTSAQGGTFVDAALGMEPVRPRDKVMDLTIGRPFFRRWLAEVMERLGQSAKPPDAAG